MSKNLQINIVAEGTIGRVDIIGNISEWSDNNAIYFRERCQAIKDAGAKTCLLYMMTNGGDCFHAEEIYNILIEIFGEYDAEGGAVIASAGAYLAAKAKSFIMAKNSQLMIHKPRGGSSGTENEIESFLTLLKNMSANYYSAFVAKLKKPEADFKAKWETGDIWMTAQEAKDWGFATEIKASVKITQALATSIKASGSPLDFDITDIISNQNKDNEMNLQSIAPTIGLAATATDVEITAKIADNAKKAGDYDALVAATAQKDKTEKAEKIKATLDKAEKEHRINAATRPNWEQMLTANFETTIKVLDSIQAVEKMSAVIVTSATGSATFQGKTFEAMQDANDGSLEALMGSDVEAYDALFADYKKRNGLK